MHENSSKVKIISLTAATLLAASIEVASSNRVQAANGDEVNSDTQSQNKARVQSDVDSAQQAVNIAQAQVNNAKQRVDQAQLNGKNAINAYNDQNQIVKDRQDDVVEKQNAYNNAQNMSNEATAQNIASAQVAVANAQAAKNSADSAVTTAQTAQTVANNAYSTARNAVTAAQIDVNNKQKAYDNAQAARTTAQAQVDATTSRAAQAAKDAAQIEVNNRTAIKNNAQVAKDNADRAVTSALSAVADAQTSKDNADNDVSVKQRAVTSAQNNLNSIRAAHSATNAITLDNTYINALKNFLADRNNTATQEALTRASVNVLRNNHYVSNPTDTAQTIDLSNLQGTNQTIAQYALVLINGVRRQLGYQELKYNTDAMNLSVDVANRYRNDNWNSMGNGHDVNGALRPAYVDMGMNGSYGEAMGFVSAGWIPNYTETANNHDGQTSLTRDTTANGNIITLDALKNNVYGIIYGMLFDDQNSRWGHAEILTNPDTDFMGVSFSVYPSSGSTSYVTLHFNPVKVSQIRDTTKFNVNANESLPSLVTSTEVTAAQNTLTTAQNTLTTAQNALTDAQIAARNASNSLIAAQNNLAVKRNAQTTAQNALTAAQAQLVQAQTALTTATNNLSNLSTVHANALTALAATQVAERTAEVALNNANSVLNSAKANEAQAKLAADNRAAILTTAQNDAVTKAAILTNAQNHLSVLQNADTNLATAYNALLAAQTALTFAQTRLNNLRPAYEAANNQISQAQNVYDTALTNLSTAQSNLQIVRRHLSNLDDIIGFLPNSSGSTNFYNTETSVINAIPSNENVNDPNSVVNTQVSEGISERTRNIPNKQKRTTKKVNFKAIVKSRHTPLVNKQGHVIGHVKQNRVIKLISQTRIKDHIYYRLSGLRGRWISAKNIQRLAERANRMVIYLKHPNKKATLVDNNGHKTGKYLTGKKAYKVVNKKMIKHHTYYQLENNLWLKASLCKTAE